MADLRLRESFPELTRDELWSAWTTSDGVRSFWAQEAEIEPTAGGRYVVRWPAMDWTMRGEVLHADPPASISFTWAWDHEPSAPIRTVTLEMLDDGEGSVLAIHHRPYGDDEAAERTSNEEGWRHFCEGLRTR